MEVVPAGMYSAVPTAALWCLIFFKHTCHCHLNLLMTLTQPDGVGGGRLLQPCSVVGREEQTQDSSAAAKLHEVPEQPGGAGTPFRVTNCPQGKRMTMRLLAWV